MIKPLLIFGLIVIIQVNLIAQQSYRLIDQQSNEPVPFAHIKILSGSWGTTSNSDGAWKNIFSLRDTVLISAIGYQTRSIAIVNLKSDTVYLQQASTTLPEIVISGGSAQEIVQKAVAAVPQNYARSFTFAGMFFSATKENETFVHYLKSSCVVEDPEYLNQGKIKVQSQFQNLSDDYREYQIDSISSIGKAFSFDHIKFQKAFFNFQNLEDWRYSFVGYLSQEAGNLYIIQAKLIGAEDKINHQVTVYINEDNYAIEKLEYDYQWDQDYFTRYHDSLRVANKRWRGTFWYEKIDNQYIPYQFHFNHQKDIFTANRKYLASQYQVTEFYPLLTSLNKVEEYSNDLMLISSLFARIEKSLDSLSDLNTVE